ncbi:MAG: extracellular solute-binding protein [Oscillospiraceae bacterium]
MKFKKITCIVLAAVMSAFALTACQKNDTKGDNPTDASTKPVEIKVGFWNVQEGLAGGENDKMLKTLEEKTGVKLIPQDVSGANFNEKIQLWATNGQLPDIFCGDFIGLGQSSFYDWVDQGVLRALPDDLSKYPHLEEYMTMNRAQQAMQNGKHYIIPRQSYGDISYSVLDRNIAYRWDLAQAAGVTKEPETWDEFRDMMKKIIAADPEGKNIGGITQTGAKILAGVMYPYGGILEKKWVINEDGRVMPSIFDGDMKAVLNLARDMYNEGTIAKDVTQVKGGSAKESFLQGKCAALAFNDGPASLYLLGRDYEEIYQGKKFLDDVKFAPIFPGADGQKWYFVDTEAWSETYISSKVDDEKMDAILRLYDFLISDEGKTLMFCGFEGEDYDLVDGKPVIREGVVLKEKYPFAIMNNLAVHNPTYWNDNFPTSIPEEYREQNRIRHTDAVENGVLPEISDSALLISTPLKDKFYYNPHEEFYKIMMATEPVDKMIDDLMADYKAKGLEAMLDEVNAVAKERGIIK